MFADDGVDRLVARYFEMWNTGDATIAAEILDPAWVDHGHPAVHSIEDVADAVGRTRAARPALRFVIDTIAVQGTVGVAVGTAQDADAEPARLAWVFQSKAGRLKELRTYRG